MSDELSLPVAAGGFVPSSGPVTIGSSSPPFRRKAPQFPCFDGLRAFAALSVLVVHTAFYSGFSRRSSFNIYTARLEIGVSVFFIISGFLLYRPFAVAHMSDNRAPAIGQFWVRRLLRIIPAYWLALTVSVYVLHVATLSPGWQGVITHYGLLQIYFPTEIFYGLGQAWSLCTEMSFYLFLPLYAALLARRRRSPSAQFIRELIGLGLLTATSFAFRAWDLNQHSVCTPHCYTDPALTKTMVAWLPSYLDLFAFGMLLAVTSAWFTARESEPAWLRSRFMPWASWTAAAAAFWAVSHLGISPQPIYVVSPWVNIAKQTLYGIFAFFLVLPAVFGPQDRGTIRRTLQFAPIAWLGIISYGIYLWHQAWISEFFKWTSYQMSAVPLWILTAAALALSIGSSSASYFLLERPLLNLKKRIGQQVR
jgi:peptidoglycan/LPS O-acetylase OafA/YrhL